MIDDRNIPELSELRAVERRLPMVADRGAAQLVVPAGNPSQPVHQWFKYKEAFSAQLLPHVLATIAPSAGPEVRLLDPFCGVGTTLVAAQEAKRYGYTIHGTGIECNPFVSFVARTKTNWHGVDPIALLRSGRRVLREAELLSPALPALSSIVTGRCISTHYARRVVALRTAIGEESQGPTRDALLLGLAATIETVSRVRRDGRALRIVDKPRQDLTRHLLNQWQRMADDVLTLRNSLPKPPAQRVCLGDGRALRRLGRVRQSVDLVLTSPPYPNNIDYSEVYKLELWLLGFVASSEEFLALRKTTFRSHPTCASLDRSQLTDLSNLSHKLFRRVALPLIERVLTMPDRFRQRVLLGYLSDLKQTLEGCFQAMRPGATAVFVVGNSLHGSTTSPYLIPTDLLLATLAESAGFDLVQIGVARSLPRRLSGNHFLRDSLVVVRRPHV